MIKLLGFIKNDSIVAAKLASKGTSVHARIVRQIQILTLKLQRHVKQNKLSGQVLKVRTGTLRRSIDFHMEETPTSVRGKVSTNVKYGKRHEFGFSGQETVKAHLRTIKQAFGQSITPKQVAVSAHTRTVNVPARSFLRSALKDMKPEIVASLKQAVSGGIRS